MALLGRFSSRNNDLEGYWGMGKIRKFSESAKINPLLIDLIHGVTPTPSRELHFIANKFSLFMREQLDKRRIPSEWVNAATLTIFFDRGGYYYRDGYWKETYGDPYILESEIVTDLGRIFRNRIYGWCEAHNPNRERRRLDFASLD